MSEISNLNKVCVARCYFISEVDQFNHTDSVMPPNMLLQLSFT